MTTTDPAANELRIDATPYVRERDGVPERLVRLKLPVPTSGALRIQARTAAGTSDIEVPAERGVASLVLETDWRGAGRVDISVSTPQQSWHTSTVLPAVRPWQIYVAQDKHFDYGWIHPVEKTAERVNILTDYYLRAAEATGLHWNLDISVVVEEYLRARPSQRGRILIEALKSGAFEVGAFWLVPFPGFLNTEELIRSLTYSRWLNEQHGIPVRTAYLQEVPSLPWGLASILAGAGIPYIVKGAYSLRNPHLRERPPLPLAEWQGPDGSGVFMRWDTYENSDTWGGYAEARMLWKGTSHEEKTEFIEATVSRYASYADYPYNAILLAGTGYDEYQQTTAVSEFIQSFNAQGWDYPRLVDATWGQFWEEIEQQTASQAIAAPVLSGDWGTTWEEWPTQLAGQNIVYRQAREIVLAAQALSALAYKFDPATHGGRSQALDDAWRGLLQFSDHNIGGITPALAEDMRDRKATYAYTALREGTRALESGVSTLAASVRRMTLDERVLLVANPNSWNSSNVVEVVMPEVGPYEVFDVASGRPLPAQLETRGKWPEHYLSFLAANVPAFGYRCFAIRDGSGSLQVSDPVAADPVLENEFFRLEVDGATGGLKSLFDRTANQELVQAGGAYQLNEYLHLSDGTLHKPHLVSLAIQEGAVSTRLIAEITSLRATLRSTYQLYGERGQVDIINELTKTPTAEPQSSWFAFPFAVADHEYVIDTPAAIVRPRPQDDGGDLLPGAGRTGVSAQTFLAVVDADLAVTLASGDAHLFQFGPQVLADPAADSDASSPLVLSWVMHNLTRNDDAVNQGGQAHFTFRYSLRTHQTPFFDAPESLRFAKQLVQDLPRAWVTDTQALLAGDRGQFISVSPDHVVATGLKVAEDGHGWILRLWECGGAAADVTIDVEALVATEVWVCDLLERSLQPLAVDAGRVAIPVPAWGLRALRFR